MTTRSNLIAIEPREAGGDAVRGRAASRDHSARLNDLLRGKTTNFSLDTLINLATQAGLSVRLDIAEAA